MAGYIGQRSVTLSTTVANAQDVTATDTTPEVTIINNTHEDTDGGREGKVIFKGQQSGGEESTLAEIQGSHDGTSDDEKGDLIFKTNDGSDGASPTERLRIDSAGTSLFAEDIELVQAKNINFKHQAGGTLRAKISADSSDNLTFHTGSSGAERMRIQSDGSTKLIADGITPTTGGMHSAENDLANSYTFMVRDHSSNPLSQYLVEFSFPSAAPNNTSAKFLQCRDSGGARLNIESNGDVKNANNTYGAISDEKLKENIVDSGSQWADIKAVKVRKYSFKADELDAANRIGVIAQELESSGMNGLVDTQKDLDLETREDLGTETKSVKYSVLYMKAIKALQEAMARIETLETKVAALEAE